MCAKRIVALLCALVAFVPVTANAQAEPSAVGAPPGLVIAVAVNDHTLEIRRIAERMVTRTTTATLSAGVKIEARKGSTGPATTTDVVPVSEEHITRFNISNIVAQRIHGTAVSDKALMAAIAKPTPIILVRRGQQVDPLYVKMFKPETLVLQLPAPQTGVPNFQAPANRLQ
jgi:hypothetical protein